MVAERRQSLIRPDPIPGTNQIALPRMWYVFVFGSLIFALVALSRLIFDYPGFPLFVSGLIGLVALISLYLWVTLRDSLSPEDISPAGTQSPALRRRLLLLSAMVLLNHALIPIFPEYEPWWLLAYSMVAAGLVLPLIPAKLMITGLTVISMAHAWFFNHAFQPILLTLAVLALGAIIIRVLTITNIELETSRNDVARLAVAEERLRFARDLHDSLGHSLSTIVLKSELSGRLAGQDPERATSEIRDVERVARDALRDVRSVVTGYRQPALDRELEVAREVLTAAGVECDVVNQTAELPPAIDAVLAWAVREGVTNIIRHSDAQHCTIRVIRENGTARLEIIDDGGKAVVDSPANRTGSGLAGLSERVASAGGRLTAGMKPDGGFELVLEAPAVSEGTAEQ
jgi:two-component system, NarL family, sensor histidine kinase DesK